MCFLHRDLVAVQPIRRSGFILAGRTVSVLGFEGQVLKAVSIDQGPGGAEGRD